METDKPILKFIKKRTGLNIAKDTLRKKNEAFSKNGAKTIGYPHAKYKL